MLYYQEVRVGEKTHCEHCDEPGDCSLREVTFGEYVR